jgi:hypothetical protein
MALKPPPNCPNQMIVEGPVDKRSIIELMSHHVDWSKPPVYIEDKGGVSKIKNAAFLTGKLKEEAVKKLGVVMDADTNPSAAYKSIRNSLLSLTGSLPKELPETGLICGFEVAGVPKRFGLWIMPDNVSAGMLETLLRYLIPTTYNPLWEHAVNSTREAKEKCAGYDKIFHDSHRDKANLRAFLAWVDEPGQDLHTALKSKALDPNSPFADPFVNWFRELYQLQEKDNC